MIAGRFGAPVFLKGENRLLRDLPHSAGWAELHNLNQQLTRGPPLVALKASKQRAVLRLECAMEFEKFFLEHYGPGSPSAAFNRHPALPDEVREAANRGWRIFPVPEVAKLTGNPDLLIDSATSEISSLEEVAAEHYPLWGFRAAVGPSSLCILQLDGPQGKNAFAALVQDQEECLTLQAVRGDIALAFFRQPKNLVLRASARKLAAGVMVLADGDSCPLLPFANPWAEVEALPYIVRELAFGTPGNPPGKAAPVLAPSPRPVPCRLAAHFAEPQRGARKGYPVCGGGYRIYRRR